MPSTVEFPFSEDEVLPTIPIILSYADSSISANPLLDIAILSLVRYIYKSVCFEIQGLNVLQLPGKRYTGSTVIMTLGCKNP